MFSPTRKDIFSLKSPFAALIGNAKVSLFAVKGQSLKKGCGSDNFKKKGCVTVFAPCFLKLSFHRFQNTIHRNLRIWYYKFTLFLEKKKQFRFSSEEMGGSIDFRKHGLTKTEVYSELPVGFLEMLVGKKIILSQKIKF